MFKKITLTTLVVIALTTFSACQSKSGDEGSLPAALGSLGASCNADGTCNTGLACVDAKCALISGGEGEACNPDASCDAGLFCLAGKCVSDGTHPDPWFCGEGHPPCPAGSVCGANNLCVTIPAGNLGGTCMADGSCAPGLNCVQNKCVAGNVPSPECSGTIPCPDGYSCNNGICTKAIFPLGGGACENSSSCSLGYECVNGYCVFQGNPVSCSESLPCPAGESCINGSCITDTTYTCTESDQCSEGFACINNACEQTSIAPVTALTATPGNHSVELKWTNPSDPNFDGVEIIVRYYGETTPPISSESSTSRTYSPLNNGFVYSFEVRTKNKFGAKSVTVPVKAMPTSDIRPGQQFWINLGNREEYNKMFALAYVPSGLVFPKGITETPTTMFNDYWIGDTEVRYDLWYAVVNWAKDNGYTFANLGREGNGGKDGDPPIMDSQPVTNISWRDAIVFMNALTEMYNLNNGDNPDYDFVYYKDMTATDGATPIYLNPIKSSIDTITNTVEGSVSNPYVKNTANGFRLPYTDEWELAARYKGEDNTNGAIAETQHNLTTLYWTPYDYASGATADATNAAATQAVAVYGVANTSPVKSKAKNGLNLYDMSGNVFEYNGDINSGELPYTVIRRGGWYEATIGYYMRISNINYVWPYYGGTIDGLRIARSAD